MKHCMRKGFIIISISALAGCTAEAVQPAAEPTLQQQEQTIEEATADGMKMQQTEGSVSVNDGSTDMEGFAGMNLYDGYGIETQTKSYGWINLDAVKLLKMDEDSSTRISQNNKNLKITLEEGSLFFCVTEHLADDESLEFEVSDMALSIRGTTGIIRKNNDDWITVVLFEGRIKAEYEDDFENLDENKTYDFYRDEDGFTMTESDIAYGGDIRSYVLDELNDNESVQQKYTLDRDYMTDEENTEAASAYLGKYQYQGSIYPRGTEGDKDGEAFVLNDPYIIAITLDDNGYYRISFSETEEAYQEIESFNERHASGGYYPEEHTGGEYLTKYLRFEDENTILFNRFPVDKLMHSDEGYLVETDGETAIYTKIE